MNGKGCFRTLAEWNAAVELARAVYLRAYRRGNLEEIGETFERYHSLFVLNVERADDGNPTDSGE